MIRVVISGTGQMGTLVLDTVGGAEDMQPVGVLEPIAPKGDSHTVLAMHADPNELFEATHPDVVVDFTNAEATPALDAVAEAVRRDVRPIDDIRSTAEYRERVLARLIYFGLERHAAGRTIGP